MGQVRGNVPYTNLKLTIQCQQCFARNILKTITKLQVKKEDEPSQGPPKKH